MPAHDSVLTLRPLDGSALANFLANETAGGDKPPAAVFNSPHCRRSDLLSLPNNKKYKKFDEQSLSI